MPCRSEKYVQTAEYLSWEAYQEYKLAESSTDQESLEVQIAVSRYSLEWMHHVFSSSSTITTSTLTTHEIEQSPTEDMGENIVHSTASTATFSETLFSISII